MKLRAVVGHYKRAHRHHVTEELAWFRSQRSFRVAVEIAANALTKSGTRHSHQYRIRSEPMRKACEALAASLSALEASTSFEELHEVVSRAVLPIPGIGELYAYDTSVRIGAYLGLAPHLIYLHRGTRVGASRLGFETRARPHLTLDEVLKLAPEFTELSPGEIEDVLCLYKDYFAGRNAIRANCFETRSGCGSQAIKPPC